MNPPIFKPFRALGYITGPVPFAVQRRGKETYVTVSVGTSWQVYDCAKLRLMLVGPQFKRSIRALACKGDLTFAATGADIIECRRVHRTGTYSYPDGGPIIQMLIMGDVLLSLHAAPADGSGQSSLAVWKIGDYNAPAILIGSSGGSIQLRNFSSGKLLFTFKGWDSAVCTMSSSPALDVVGIGLADGRAVLHNTVMTFGNAAGVGLNSDLLLAGGAGEAQTTGAGGACAAMAFRTGAGLPLMAAGGGAGVITIWNLEERKLHAVIKDAHDAQLLCLHFFAGEPLLMSAGGDNSVKQWVFDGADASARLLRFRSGHSAPPTCCKHYGQGARLLSAGMDRAFRVFSCIQVRERDWCNVITAHEGDPCAYTWRLQHFALGEHVLSPPSELLGSKPAAPVTCVALSSCGNFGLVGSGSGRVDRYNMQSGIHRGAYSRVTESVKANGVLKKYVTAAHDGAVVGIAVDSRNFLMVSCGYDKTMKVTSELNTIAVPTHMSLHTGSSLCAVAGHDLGIRMFDIEAGRLVRRFKGHKDRITAIQISSDSRWLLSASMDSTIRVWDIPAAQCLQVMRLGSAPITSLSLSPALDMLVVFGNPADYARHSEEEVDLCLPTVGSGRNAAASIMGQDDDDEMDGEEAGSSSDDADSSEGSEEEAKEEVKAAVAEDVKRSYEQKDPRSGAPQPLSPALVTLSLLPKAQWQSLIHLEAIKERNKPIQPPKKPEAAPFFLPTVPGLDPNPVFDTAEYENSSKALEFEEDEEALENIGLLLECISGQMAASTNYEFCQAVLQVILQVHGEAIMSNLKLCEAATQIHERLQTSCFPGIHKTARP
eukprot:gene15273-21355_t